MKKLLSVFIILLLCCSVFAVEYPFSIILFPAISENGVTLDEAVAYNLSNRVCKAIDSNATLSALNFHKDNPIVTWNIENEKLEESDRDYPVDPSNAERIAEGLEAEGYAFVKVLGKSEDTEKKKLSFTYALEIYRIGEEQPVYNKTFTAKTGLTNDIASAFDKCVHGFVNNVRKDIQSLKGYKLKENVKNAL